jgi:glycosyltransferase involved in cell wall biosynthesis
VKKLSVIVTTYNRPKLGARIADALRSQRDVEVEFVAMDDGSDPFYDLKPDVQVRREDDGYHHLWCINEGLQAASNSLVVFLDDDTVPQGIRWAVEHLRVLEECDASRGPFAMVLYDGPRLLWSSPIMYGRIGTHFTTTNVGFRKELLMGLGGMDLSFDGHYGFGDLDLWLRMEDAGMTVGYAGNDAFALHLGKPNGGDPSRNRELLARRWGDRVKEVAG